METVLKAIADWDVYKRQVLQDKADEKKAQRTVSAQTKHKQQDMEL